MFPNSHYQYHRIEPARSQELGWTDDKAAGLGLISKKDDVPPNKQSPKTVGHRSKKQEVMSDSVLTRDRSR
jgi:hypothetical protein